MQQPAKPTEDNLGLVLREFWGQWKSPLRVVPIRSTGTSVATPGLSVIGQKLLMEIPLALSSHRHTRC